MITPARGPRLRVLSRGHHTSRWHRKMTRLSIKRAALAGSGPDCPQTHCVLSPTQSESAVSRRADSESHWQARVFKLPVVPNSNHGSRWSPGPPGRRRARTVSRDLCYYCSVLLLLQCTYVTITQRNQCTCRPCRRCADLQSEAALLQAANGWPRWTGAAGPGCAFKLPVRSRCRHGAVPRSPPQSG